jgi:hypothetical protein
VGDHVGIPGVVLFAFYIPPQCHHHPVRIKHCCHTVLVSFLSRVVGEFLLHPVNLADIFFFFLLLLLLAAPGGAPGLLHTITSSIVVMY